MPAREAQLVPLIERAKAGDPQALEKLLVDYRPYLHFISREAIGVALGRRFDPSDLVQQACIEAVEAFADFRGETEPQFTAWLKQILRRNVANVIRDNRAAKRDLRKESPLLDQDGSASLCWWEPADGGSSPSKRMVRGEAALELAAALEELSEDQRTAVTMRYLEGASVQEIAKQLGRTKPAVAGLLHRTLKALRDKLELP